MPGIPHADTHNVVQALFASDVDKPPDTIIFDRVAE